METTLYQWRCYNHSRLVMVIVSVGLLCWVSKAVVEISIYLCVFFFLFPVLILSTFTSVEIWGNITQSKSSCRRFRRVVRASFTTTYSMTDMHFLRGLWLSCCYIQQITYFCRPCIVVAFSPLRGFKSKRNHFWSRAKMGCILLCLSI